ncbi:unnamed protein product [Penicillium pancosmium]
MVYCGLSATYRDQHVVIASKQVPDAMDTEMRISLPSEIRLPRLYDNAPLRTLNGNQEISERPKLSKQAEVQQFEERPDHDPWYKISVSLEDQALHFFFHHYVVHGSGRASSHPDCLGIIYARASGTGYLANLINAVGLRSLAYLRNAPTLALAPSQTFSHALRGIRVALADPLEAASDQMLVAVMLLALYELINCLQRELRVPIPLINWMADARAYETVQEVPAARLADIIVKLCAIIASAKAGIVDKQDLSRHISTLLSIDTDFECWTKTIPVEYGYRTFTDLKLPTEAGTPSSCFGDCGAGEFQRDMSQRLIYLPRV